MRLRRLRYTKRLGRDHILGEWLLAWLRDGEQRDVKRKRNTDLNELAKKRRRSTNQVSGWALQTEIRTIEKET